MGFSREEEEHGTLGIVHNLGQAVDVGEEQMGALVGGETTTETNHQRVGRDALQQRHDTCRVALVAQPRLAELLADVVDELLLQCHTRFPDFGIGHLLNGVPNGFVALVEYKARIEIFVIDETPFRGRPGGQVHAVGDVAHVVFFGEIALPQGCKHLLAHPSVELAHTVHLLAGVAGKDTHAETFVVIIGIFAAHSYEFVPRYAQHFGVTTHIFSKESFVKIVVTCRNGRVHGVERRGAHQFQGLVEGESFGHVIAQTLQVAERGMPLVAVINVFLDAQFLQRQDAADAQQNLLLETILPIAAIEAVGDGTVELGVHVVVGVQQIKADAPHIRTPHQGMHMIVHIGHVDHHLIAVGIEHTLNGQGIEILRVILGNLLAVHAEALCEIAITIEEPHGTHVDIAVRSLFQIVAGQHAQTARIDFQHLRQTKFHAEIGHRGTLLVGFHSHVIMKLRVNILHAFHERFVLHDSLFPLVAQTLEQQHRVVVDSLIEVGIEALEELGCLIVPCPP